MNPQRGPQRARNTVLTALLVAVAVLAVAPTGISLPGGIGTGDGGFDAAHGGCTACHGGGSFATQDAQITVVFTDVDGNTLTGLYQHGATYTVKIILDEQNGLDADNHAGLNLYADGGSFEAGDNTRLHDSGEIVHDGPGFTTWTALWTAPEEGAVVFRLFVNDVNGELGADEGDQVYYKLWSLTDDTANLPGAVEEHEPHVGVPLPQYWLGLIALATMMAVILFAYVYLKYSNPHNADQKDR